MASSPKVLPPTTSWTNSPWQCRQLSCRIWLLFALMRIGSSKTSFAPGGARGLEGEAGRVVVPIQRLGDVLAQKLRRDVAIVAGREGVVWPFSPRIVFVAHDVAVDACRGIVAEIGEAGRVFEGRDADTDHRAEKRAEEDPVSRPHAGLLPPVPMDHKRRPGLRPRPSR